MKHLTFSRTLLSALLLLAGAAAVAQTSVIPMPVRITPETGMFRISSTTQLQTNLKGAERRSMSDYLATLPAPFSNGFGGKQEEDVVVLHKLTKKERGTLTDTLPANAEGYRMEVTPRRIWIEATTDTGLFYGLQTLLQTACPAGNGTWTVAAEQVADAPRFAYRGFMMDVSRHFRSREFVEKQLDAMARYKLNRLHLHLTDGAGWRLEIKKYPRLAEFAAWRPQATYKEWTRAGSRYCEQSDPRASGGYFTQEDVRRLVRYAAERHITIVPEIEMPGHSSEVLAAYPELSCAGQPYKNSDYCAGNEETFKFLEEVLTEVMAIFPSEYIHIGGDEAGKRAWRTCPKCQQRMKDEHLSNVDELQSYFIRRIGRFLEALGR
jgi:hexosaminidase